MALIYVAQSSGQCHIIGLSSDTKPAPADSNGLSFFEVDTGNSYLCNGAVWDNTTATGSGASATTVEQNLSATPTWRGKFTITDAAISPTSKVMCWQAPGPYTGKGTLADEAEMQPVQVIAVAPTAGSATVMWQTPPMVATSQQLNNGRLNAAGATFDRLMNQRTPSVATATRINKVRGNVKFSYMVLS